MKAHAPNIIAWCVSLMFVFGNAVGATQHAGQTGSQTELTDLRERMARAEETDKRILEQLAFIREDIANLKEDMRRQNSNMDKRFEELKADVDNRMDTRFEELKADMDKQFGELRADMRLQNSSINNWLIALFSGILALALGILALAGIFVTYALGYWGPNKSASKTEGHGFAEQQRREVEARQEA